METQLGSGGSGWMLGAGWIDGWMDTVLLIFGVYQPYTLPRLSVLAAPFLYRREGRYWIPGSFSVLACGSLMLLPGVQIFRLAFGMLSCWLMLGLLFGLAYGWRCLRCGKVGLSS